MAYPSGVETCPVFIDAPVTFGGADATVYLEITPSTRLIWSATGQTFADFVVQPAVATTGTATVVLPTIQPGFKDEAGNTVQSWAYCARVRFVYQGKNKYAPLKWFSLPAGSQPVDLTLIPSGPAAPVLTAPALPVTSVNGETGAVTVEGLNYAVIARDPSALFVGPVTLTNGAPTSAAVTWPDGTTGTYTGAPSSAFPGSIDAYSITKGATTYTQPAVTRDGSGNITVQPAIVVS